MNSIMCRDPHSFLYNSSSATTATCACSPGHYFSSEKLGNCTLWWPSGGGGGGGEWRSGMGPNPDGGLGPTTVLGQVLPLDPFERVVSSETAAAKATGVAVLFWLAFCLAVRLGGAEGGRTAWFRARWWISRMDLRFSTSHTLEDLKVVRKRKTELGGMFSVASWILFVGLLSASSSESSPKLTDDFSQVALPDHYKKKY